MHADTAALACDLQIELACAAWMQPDAEPIFPAGIDIRILETGDAQINEPPGAKTVIKLETTDETTPFARG